MMLYSGTIYWETYVPVIVVYILYISLIVFSLSNSLFLLYYVSVLSSPGEDRYTLSPPSVFSGMSILFATAVFLRWSRRLGSILVCVWAFGGGGGDTIKRR